MKNDFISYMYLPIKSASEVQSFMIGQNRENFTFDLEFLGKDRLESKKMEKN